MSVLVVAQLDIWEKCDYKLNLIRHLFCGRPGRYPSEVADGMGYADLVFCMHTLLGDAEFNQKCSTPQ